MSGVGFQQPLGGIGGGNNNNNNNGVQMPFGLGGHVPTTIPRAAAIASCLYGHLGNNINQIPMQVYQYNDGTPNEKIWTDLWSAWDGKNWPSTEIFLNDLTTRGSEFLDLFPIVPKKVAMEKFQMNFIGDNVTFDEWDFQGRVIANASKRHPAKLNRSQKISTTQSMYFASDGFEMPMDFVADETLMRVFLSHMEQLNLNIHLTWTFRLLQVLVDRGLGARIRRMVDRKMLPMNHSKFDQKFKQDNDSMFGIQKPNSKGYGLIESDAYNTGRDRNVFFDTVITTAGSLVFTGLIRPEVGIYAERGEEIYNKKTPEPEGNKQAPSAKTPGYGLAILETRKFGLGDGQEDKDPTVYQANVAHRYLMSPHILPSKCLDENYRSEMRNISIPDADNPGEKTLDLKMAFLFSCIFSTRSDTITLHGIKILKRLCARKKQTAPGFSAAPGGPGGRSNHGNNKGNRGGKGGSNPFDDDEDGGNDSYGKQGISCPPLFGGMGESDDDAAALDPASQYDTKNDGLPGWANAFSLFDNAGILQEVIKILRQQPEEKYRSFLSEIAAQGTRTQPYVPPQPTGGIGSKQFALTELDMLASATASRRPAAPAGSSTLPSQNKKSTLFGGIGGGSGHQPFVGMSAKFSAARMATGSSQMPANVFLKPELNSLFVPFDHDTVVFGRNLNEGGTRPATHSSDIYTKFQAEIKALKDTLPTDDNFSKTFTARMQQYKIILSDDHSLGIVEVALLTTLVSLAFDVIVPGRVSQASNKFSMWCNWLLAAGDNKATPANNITRLAMSSSGQGQAMDSLKKLLLKANTELSSLTKISIATGTELLTERISVENSCAVQGSDAFADGSHTAPAIRSLGGEYDTYPFLRNLLRASKGSMPPSKNMDNTIYSLDQLEWLSENVLLNRKGLDECDQMLIERAVYKILSGDPAVAGDKQFGREFQTLLPSDRSKNDTTNPSTAINYILVNSTTRPGASLQLTASEKNHLLNVTKQLNKTVREQKKRRFQDLNSDSDNEDDGVAAAVSAQDETDNCLADTVGAGDGGANGKRVRLEPAKVMFRTASTVCRMLWKMRLSKNFFHQLILNDIPFPMVFLVFQPHIRIMAGCCIFLKSGPETCIMAINRGSIIYGRDINSFTVNVSARLSAGAFVRKETNLHLTGHTFANEYKGGGGCKPYDLEEHKERYSAELYPADLFFVACPYWFEPDHYFTDMSGEMDGAIYSDDRFTGLMYPTADIYRQVWPGWNRRERPVPHMWSAEHYIESIPRNNLLCVQSSQTCFKSTFGGSKGNLKKSYLLFNLFF